MKIWVNCIVHNEENFIWFAIMSVIDYVDKVLVWDTGSTDKTVDIIRKVREVKGSKVEINEVGKVDKEKFTRMRQAMLDESKGDWILILDGDEIWWEDSIKKVVDFISHNKEINAVAVPFYNMVGDIYHYQSEEAGRYELAGRKGHLTVRVINRHIPGLHLAGPYGEESYMDEAGQAVQDMGPRELFFLQAPFLHLTHLTRSSKNRHNKFKYDLGKEFKENFPEALYLKRPSVVPSPWKSRSKLHRLLSIGKKILKP